MIYSILTQLKQTSSRNDKLAILKANQSNTLLQRVFKLSLDPLITFGVKKIPSYTTTVTPDVFLELDSALDQLTPLITRSITKHAELAQHLTTLLQSLHPDDAKVFESVLQKDLSCGVLSTTCNAVWPGLVPDLPVMKATPNSPKALAKIQYPAFSQMKVDGARTQLRITSDGVVIAYSSSGNEYITHGNFDYLTKACRYGRNVVLDGEMVVIDDNGEILPRKRGNGIINKAIKGTITTTEAKRLVFIAFDLIEEEKWVAQYSSVPYWARLQELAAFITPLTNPNIKLVETKTINSEVELFDHFFEMHKTRGLEGTVVKNTTCIWENTRSRDQVKIVGVLNCDLLVIDTLPGTGKHEGKIGALMCISSDKLLSVNVGSGLTDAERSLPPSTFIGKIVEIFYKERIDAETGTLSLFAPRFNCIRTDKLIADSINEIPLH